MRISLKFKSARDEEVREQTTSPIRSWSYSRLTDFESCPYKAKLKYVDRLAEQKAPAAERGTQIHQLAEDFVVGKIKDLPKELVKFTDEFAALRAQYLAGSVSLEGEWGFDKDWNITDYKTAWLRMKADAVITKTPDHAIIVDHKTGKRYGNELKHGEQVQLYGIAALLRNEHIMRVTVELWYLDLDDLHSATYTRTQALKYLPQFEKRGLAITRATAFPPRPNIFSCKFCSFGPAKGGQCEYGVLPGDTNISQYRRKFL